MYQDNLIYSGNFSATVSIITGLLLRPVKLMHLLQLKGNQKLVRGSLSVTGFLKWNGTTYLSGRGL
jgi:hypothetical protein